MYWNTAASKSQLDVPSDFTMLTGCEKDTLTYGCLCGNNQKPNITEYTLTLPFFVCQEWGTQCVKNCPSTDSACQASCQQDHPCGARDPEGPKTKTASGSATMTPTASSTDDGTTIFTGTPGSDSSSDTKPSKSSSGSGASKDDKPDSMATALGVGRVYGLAAVMGGMFTIFAFL